MGKSRKKQRAKALKIFEGNEAAQQALKQAFSKKGYSGSKISNKEVQQIIAAGGTEDQLKRLTDRVQSSSGRLSITNKANTYKDISLIFNPDRDKPSPSGLYDADGNPVQQATIDVPDYGSQISGALSASDARMDELMNQLKIDQEAALERQRLAEEARQRQMLIGARRERAAGRSPSLQIRGAGELSKTAGTQGFRRRRDQFKRREYQPLAPIATQGSANQLVNI